MYVSETIFRHPKIRLLIGLAVSAILVGAGIRFGNTLREWAQEHIWLFPLFVFFAQLLFVPRITMLVLSGILFHPLVGAVLTLTADTAAALVVHAWARWSFSPSTGLWLQKRPRLAHILEILSKRHPVWTLALVRILPFTHFSTTSLAAGALAIPVPAYLAGTILGCIPTALAWPLAADALVHRQDLWPALVLGTVLFLLVYFSWYSLQPYAIKSSKKD